MNLKAKERKLTEALADAVARQNHLEDDKAATQRKRDRADGLERDRLTEEIHGLNRELRRVRGNVKERRSWLKKVRRAIRRARRPRVIDLKLGFRPMEVQGSVNKVIGHYTAGPQDEDTEDAIRLCRIYHEAHLNKGWSGEAYMLCFTVDGDILVLRPAKYVGAHTLGFNTGSYGVMCHGTTGDRPTRAQKRAMRWWAKNGHKPVMGNGQTKTRPADLPWYGHNDFGATACPGSFKTAYLSKGK